MRVLYLMHVDWRWIKQRPHFIAERLAESHDVRVLYPFSPRRMKLPRNRTNVATLPLLPNGSLPMGLARIRDAVQVRWVKAIAKQFRPDVVWVSFPTLLPLIRGLPPADVVYDCMDDAPSFYSREADAARITELEAELCRAAKHIFVSSEHLKHALGERTGARATVVRNAVSEQWLAERGKPSVAQPGARTTTHIAYIGTISEWLDLDAIRAMLDAAPSLVVHLVGPVARTVTRTSDPRIIWHGPVAHSDLPKLVADFDAFVMPFKVTPLIEGVDPVKLYEYLSFGKPTVSVWYREIARFEPYIHFYRSREELGEFAVQLTSGTLQPRASAADVQRFVGDNTWSNRARTINEVLQASARAQS